MSALTSTSSPTHLGSCGPSFAPSYPLLASRLDPSRSRSTAERPRLLLSFGRSLGCENEPTSRLLSRSSDTPGEFRLAKSDLTLTILPEQLHPHRRLRRARSQSLRPTRLRISRSRPCHLHPRRDDPFPSQHAPRPLLAQYQHRQHSRTLSHSLLRRHDA